MHDVSIIMPVYNAEKFIAQALHSILTQTHQSFELIAIDDGSTDRSWEILTDFACRDKRVLAWRRENRGVAATANECLEKARNPLVVRIDADDIMLPNRLERQLWFMQRHQEVSVACCYAWLIDSKGHLVARSTPKVDVDRGIRECNPNHFVGLIQPATIVRKQHIAAVGGYSASYRFAEDRELWGRLVASGYRLDVQPEFLVKQRIHGSSLTAQSMRKNELVCQFIDENIVRLLRGHTSLSFEDFLHRQKNLSFFRRFVQNIRVLSSVCYKQATRDYAEQQWWRFLKHGISAVCLNPAVGFRMLQKVTFGALWGMF